MPKVWKKHPLPCTIFSLKVFGDAGKKVVIEDCLEGKKYPFWLTDGKDIIILPSAQDHKAAWEEIRPKYRRYEAYSPTPVLSKNWNSRLEQVFTSFAV